MKRLRSIKNLKYVTAAALTTYALTSPVGALADGATINISGNADAKQIVGNIIGIIIDVFFYIGVLLACWSVGMLVLAFKNEDADSKSRAMMMLVCSVCLIGIRTFLGSNGIGLIS